MTSVVGWDIGGANLKAARAEDGRIVAVTQQPCAPHLGLANVEQAIRAANAIMGPADIHAVTMTAELSDAFEDRLRGVASIAAIFTHEIDAPDIVFYAGAAGFVGKADVARAAPAIASANWRASAALVARGRAEALFMDMGSTTTDIVPIRGGVVAAFGEDDAAVSLAANWFTRVCCAARQRRASPWRPSMGNGRRWSTSNSRPWPTCTASSIIFRPAPTSRRPSTAAPGHARRAARDWPASSAATRATAPKDSGMRSRLFSPGRKCGGSRTKSR